MTWASRPEPKQITLTATQLAEYVGLVFKRQ